MWVKIGREKEASNNQNKLNNEFRRGRPAGDLINPEARITDRDTLMPHSRARIYFADVRNRPHEEGERITTICS
jgi:hypothetical protein